MERVAADALHGDEAHSVDLVDLVDDRDVWMLELRRGSGLLDEPVFALGIGDEVERQHLEGHLPVELYVERTVRDTHAASTDLVEDSVVGKRLADHARPVRLLSEEFYVKGQQRSSHPPLTGVLHGSCSTRFAVIAASVSYGHARRKVKDTDARHGRCYRMTRVVKDRTKSRWLNAEQAGQVREQVAAGKEFRRLVEEYWQTCEQWADARLEDSEAGLQEAAKKGFKKRRSKSRPSPKPKRS